MGTLAPSGLHLDEQDSDLNSQADSSGSFELICVPFSARPMDPKGPEQWWSWFEAARERELSGPSGRSMNLLLAAEWICSSSH